MVIRTSNDPFGSPTSMVDRLIGNAFTTVRHVSENIEYIKHVSVNFEALYRVYESVDNLDDFITNIPKIDIVIANIPIISTVSTNIIAINGLYTNLNALLNLNTNTAAIAANAASAANSAASALNSLGAIQDIEENILLNGLMRSQNLADIIDRPLALVNLGAGPAGVSTFEADTAGDIRNLLDVFVRVGTEGALKALDTSKDSLALFNGEEYLWLGGNYETLISFGDAGYVSSNANPTGTLGSWNRRTKHHTPASIHNFRAYQSSAVNFSVEGLEDAVSYWSAVGAPESLFDPFSPTFFVQGAGANIGGNFAAKGEAGFIFGNILGKMLEIVKSLPGYITDRFIKIGAGSTAAAEYPSIDSEDGWDVKVDGSTIVRYFTGLGNAFLNIRNNVANYIVLSAQTGKGLILLSDLGIQIKGISYETRKYTEYDVLTGTTVNLSQFTGQQWLRPNAGNIAAATIDLPTAPEDGSIIRVSSRGTITAVTWTSGPGGVTGGPTTMNGTTPVTFQYHGAIYGWERI